MNYLIFIPFLILLIVYCYLEKKNKFYSATTLKVILSAYIAGVAWIPAIEEQSLFYTLMAIGLTFAVPADFCLQYIKSNSLIYRFGILFFGAMHLCLITSFFMNWNIYWYEFLILVILILFISYFQKSEKWNLGKEKMQLSVYTLLVTLMASKAISVFIVNPDKATLMIALGGLFFFISDLFLGIWDYYKDKFIFLCLNRIIYFTGQILLAFSLTLITL